MPLPHTDSGTRRLQRQINIRLDEDLHRRWKEYLERHKLTESRMLRTMIEEEIAKDNV